MIAGVTMITDTLQQALHNTTRPWLQRLDNGRARLFQADALSQAEQTPHETLFDDGLVKLRYYCLLYTSPSPRDRG